MAFANLVVEVGLNGSAFSRGVDKVIAGAKRMNTAFGTAVTSFAKNQILQAFTVAAVINKVQAGVSEAISFGSAITDLSKTLGVSTDNLQLWNYAATQNGATIGDVTMLYQTLAKSRQIAVNGSETEIAAYKKLGITIDDLKNKRLEDLAAQIGKAFEAGDPQALIASLREVGGRGAGALISAFEAGIGATFDEGLKLKIVINPEELAKIDELGDKMEIMQMRMRPIFVTVASLGNTFKDALLNAGRIGIAFIEDALSHLTFGFSKLTGIGKIKGQTWQSVIDKGGLARLAQEVIDDEKAAAKKKEDRERKAATKAKVTPLVDESIPKKLRPVKKEKMEVELLPKITDSLAKFGGFTLGRDVLTLTVAKQQLAVLETISDNTKNIGNPIEGDGLP